jgi:hypothetical protein
MHLPGQQVDPGQKARRAMTFVFVVACERRVRSGLRRQIRRGVADRLDTGLLVIRDDGDVVFGPAFTQERDFAIDAEDLGHLCLERLVAPFEIVARLVWLYLVAREDLADSALHDFGHARMPGRLRVLANVTRQQPRGPQLVWVSQVLRLAARQRHQPGARLGRDHGCLGRSRTILECCKDAHLRGAAHATPNGVAHDPDLLAHGNRRRVGMIRQKDPRPFDPDRRFASRPGNRFQPGQIVRAHRQFRHATRCCHDALPPH